MTRATCILVVACALFMCCDFATAHASPASEARQAVAALCPGRMALAPVFARAAEKYDLPAAALVAIAFKESSCNPMAIGLRGERGLMQIKPWTRADGNVSPARLHVPAVNVELGAAHLARCLLLCGELSSALSVYNGKRRCGPSGYSKRVLGLMAQAQGARS